MMAVAGRLVCCLLCCLAVTRSIIYTANNIIMTADSSPKKRSTSSRRCNCHFGVVTAAAIAVVVLLSSACSNNCCGRTGCCLAFQLLSTTTSSKQQHQQQRGRSRTAATTSNIAIYRRSLGNNKRRTDPRKNDIIDAGTAAAGPLFSFSSFSRDAAAADDDVDDNSTDSSSTAANVDLLKAKLVRCCDRKPKASVEEVRDLVRELEESAEQRGIGQASSISGLLSGEWELLWAPEDVTRSSPFFWAFSRAFPQNADQIYAITDSIPSPIKDVGPATQSIEFDASTQTGKFVSRVKVATLGGMATSIMTTRATITGVEGVDGIRLQIESTKPERSTLVSKLFGPLGDAVNDSAPAFPSGQALEQVQPGSSEVVMRTTFCDEGLRISRNEDNFEDEFFVFRRRDFASSDFV